MKKQIPTKRALLSSALALLLCVSMLIGSTFAWFTDEAVSGNNKIVSGTLKVDLEVLENGEFISVKESNKAIFDYDNWEPGYTVAKILRVSNKGSLALKWVAQFVAQQELSELANVIDVYVKTDANQMPSDRDLEGYERVGTVAEFVNKITKTTYGNLLAGESTYLGIALKMQETAGNEYQGMDLGGAFDIKILATQYTYEPDSFGPDYDGKASVTFGNSEDADYNDLAKAVAEVEDGGVIYIEPGTYQQKSVITIDNKDITIVGLSQVTLTYGTGGTHFFNVRNGSNVTFENITMTGASKHGVYVRNNSVVTMRNVDINGSKGSADIMIDEASDAAHGRETVSAVNLYSCNVDRVAICAAPVKGDPDRQDTYVYFNYDKDSKVNSVEKQDINIKPENIYINGNNTPENETLVNFYVTNDAELAAALQAIKTDSKYWNKEIFIHMAAGTYSGDHVVNQYPQWNGIVGKGNSGNNYATGVAGADRTNITFVGEEVATFARTSVPGVVFTGNVQVLGFGNSDTGFTTAVARTTFKNVAFDATNSPETKAGDYIALYVKSAANNVTFEGCTFINASHITIGGSGSEGVGKVDVVGCTFRDGGCLSGGYNELNITDTVVDKARNGFVDNKKSGTITVKNCQIETGKYFLRTDNSGVHLIVEDSTISVYESEEKKNLVHFRGSNNSATFTDCTIADGWTTEGVSTTNTLEILNWFEEDGVQYYKDGVTKDVVLYFVPSTYTKSELVIPEGVTWLGNGSIGTSASKSLKKVVCPSTLLGMGTAFQKNTVIEEVVLNEGLTEIPEKAFNQATALKSVNIPSTVQKIGLNAFRAIAVEELTIPANVKELAEGAFRDMPYVKTITIEGNPVIGNFAFRECHVLETVNLNGFDVTFAGTSIAFSNKQSGESNGLVINVTTEEMKARVKAANGSGTNYIVNVTTDWETIENASGVYTRNGGKEYGVATAEGLAWIEAQADDFFAGKTVKLACDIDCGGQTIKSATFFAPENRTVVDGQGHTISNLKIINSGNAGLFNGTTDIKNLNVEDAEVSGTYAGVLAGNLYGNIENCHVKEVKVTTTYWQAGILVGQYNSGNITGCTVEDCVVEGASSVGVLVGILNETAGVRKVENCTIRNCQVNQTGSFGADYDTLFGIVTGYVNIHNSQVYITNCTIEGNTLKGAASDLLYGEKLDSTTVTVN